METNRTRIDPEKGRSESRLGKSRFEKPHAERTRRGEEFSESDQSVDKRVERLRTALRSIGGCCNDTDCLGAI